jgi:hypothetical protein
MKKEKQHFAPTNNKYHKKKRHNKCKVVASSTPHDDQLSIVMAFSIIPKCNNPSSIRSHLHPSSSLGLVHIEKS